MTATVSVKNTSVEIQNCAAKTSPRRHASPSGESEPSV
jgi:hypothetical protein